MSDTEVIWFWAFVVAGSITFILAESVNWEWTRERYLRAEQKTKFVVSEGVGLLVGMVAVGFLVGGTAFFVVFALIPGIIDWISN